MKEGEVYYGLLLTMKGIRRVIIIAEEGVLTLQKSRSSNNNNRGDVPPSHRMAHQLMKRGLDKLPSIFLPIAPPFEELASMNILHPVVVIMGLFLMTV